MTRSANSLRVAWLGGVLAVVLTVPISSGRESGVTPERDSHDRQRGSGQREAGQAQTSPLPPVRWSWWRDDQVQAELGLTEAQVTSIEAIYQERQTALRPFIREFIRLDRETDRLALERSVSVEEFAIQVASLENVRAKLAESRTVMLYRMKLEIDEAQYAKLQQIRDERGRGRGDRGSSRRNGPDR